MKNYDDLRHGSKWKEIKGIKKTGVKGMSIDSLLMFSEIYGVSTDYILKGDKTLAPSDALLEELGALVQKYKSL